MHNFEHENVARLNSEAKDAGTKRHESAYRFQIQGVHFAESEKERKKDHDGEYLDFNIPFPKGSVKKQHKGNL
jgi:hypothetical protein